MDLGHRAASAKFVIRDRAGQFAGVDAVVTAEGIRIVRSPPQPPEADAICERSIGTLRREVPGRLLIVNEHHLRTVLTEYLRHDNTGRPHRAPGQLTPAQADTGPPGTGQSRRASDPPETSTWRAHPRALPRRPYRPHMLPKTQVTLDP